MHSIQPNATLSKTSRSNKMLLFTCHWAVCGQKKPTPTPHMVKLLRQPNAAKQMPQNSCSPYLNIIQDHACQDHAHACQQVRQEHLEANRQGRFLLQFCHGHFCLRRLLLRQEQRAILCALAAKFALCVFTLALCFLPGSLSIPGSAFFPTLPSFFAFHVDFSHSGVF